MPNDFLFTGLDIGTSGARAIVIDAGGDVVSEGQCVMAEIGPNHRDPKVWLGAAKTALSKAFTDVDTKKIKSLCVDGTSGTMIPIDQNGMPLAVGSMYNDPCQERDILGNIAEIAPVTSAAHGATSGLARAISFNKRFDAHKIVHQADWVAGQLCGVYSSDENNALKTGYDPVAGNWPDWIEKTGISPNCLPIVEEPGCPISKVTSKTAAEFGLSEDTLLVAGTTDGCASFLATGAENVGDGVTALGTTLTIKILSEQPIFSPESGIYSHRILGNWLAGGASNTGGNVLLANFEVDEIQDLTQQIDASSDSPLDYYPLSKPGERFPIADPDLQPRLTPRPDDDSEYLKGILQGMTAIEKLGYSQLVELGGPNLSSLRTVGRGAKNKAWTQMRARMLAVPMLPPTSNEAAYGTALLARRGASN